jgi:hypothetical protein
MVAIGFVAVWSVLSKSMNHALRMQQRGNIGSDNYTGNREISLPRIKLVAKPSRESLAGVCLNPEISFCF